MVLLDSEKVENENDYWILFDKSGFQIIHLQAVCMLESESESIWKPFLVRFILLPL